jgi:hypothetical protein
MKRQNEKKDRTKNELQKYIASNRVRSHYLLVESTPWEAVLGDRTVALLIYARMRHSSLSSIEN